MKAYGPYTTTFFTFKHEKQKKCTATGLKTSLTMEKDAIFLREERNKEDEGNKVDEHLFLEGAQTTVKPIIYFV